MKSFFGTLAAGAIALAAFALPASAQTVLRVSNWLPPSHPIVKDIVLPWAAAVEEATDGRVTVQMLDAPLGPPPAHFDLAATGAADVTFGVNGYTPGRFSLNQIAELPFLTPSSEALSVAYWRVYEKMLAEKDEYKGVKVLAVWGHGPGMLFTTGAEVSPLSKLDGLKVRVAGKLTSMLAEQMKMVSVQAPSPKTYEVLSGGVADAIYFPYESVPFFKLDSLLTKALRAEGGLYNVSFFMVMNQAKFDGLSDEDKAAIDGVSGEALVRIAGKAWDAADATGHDILESTVAFHDASEAEMEELVAMSQPLYDAVAADYAAKGVDFDAALEMLKAETAKVLQE
ncbi:TRAP transporter substrate-binding protein [Chachezhania sediminis]|uniref:TRAP transporter substrate-binding protein n=1 Tax=Chachezhania sediminis TaxID=2599291 RepID=UPI00131B3397|nr:TRAP transporter substrate-binding protein [Chachezhania sediminis]